MKKYETWIHAVLLIGVLIWARQIWKGVSPDEMTRVVLFDPGPNGLTEIRWEEPDETSILTVTKTGKETETRVRTGKRPKIEPAAPPEAAAPADDGAEAPSVEHGEEEKPVEAAYGDPEWKEFPGSKSASTLVDDASPLAALRQFEGVQPVEMEEMGFNSPVGTLTLKAPSRELKLEVGANAFGSTNAYARKPGDRTVYLLPSKIVSPVKDAENRLMDRRLYDFEAADVVRADIHPISGETLSALHQSREDEENDFWARSETPNDADEDLKKVMVRLLRTAATTYPLDSESVEEAGLFIPMRVVFHGEKGRLGEVALGGLSKPREVPLEGGSQLDDDPEKNPPVDFDWFARSDRTQVWVPISRTSAIEISESLKALLGR